MSHTLCKGAGVEKLMERNLKIGKAYKKVTFIKEHGVRISMSR